MDDRIANKRRKLNHNNGATSPGTSKSNSSEIAQNLLRTATTSTAASTRKQTAGVKSNGAHEVDVYDDIEGALPPQQQPLVKTPAKSRAPLDPVSNQKAQHSPQTLTKSTIPKDFFKKFRSSAKKTSQTPAKEESQQGSAPDKPTDQLRNATATPSGKEAAEASDVDIDEIPQSEAVRSSGRQRKRPAKFENGIEVTDVNDRAKEKPRKRTVEDELQEVQHAAQKKAIEEQSAESSPKPSRKRRVSARAKQGEVPTPKPSARNASARKQAQPLQTKVDKIGRLDNDEADDAMDVDGPAQSTISAPQPEPDSILATPAKSKSKNSATNTCQATDIIFTPEQLQNFQLSLLEVITGQRTNKLARLEAEFSKVSSLVTQTITAGESNSMLLIGARGSGKTTIINQILHEQTKAYANEFHVVRLNGFIHTDDKIAIREIWRQLGREMEIETDGDSGRTKNIADTMTTLLALLSHPAEQGREEETGATTKSVIFVLDEFELFAMHPRQTLLYNLFDIAQSRKAPIAVLGLTTRIDVAEALEKRVKSRFSHRYVHLSLSKSLSGFQDACRAALAMDSKAVKRQDEHSLDDQAFLDDFNSFMDQLFASGPFSAHLNRLYYTTKSIPEFLTSLLLAVSTIPTKTKLSSSELLTHFITNMSSASHPDSKLSLLTSLSTIHLALLICAARLVAIHSADSVSFVQAYEEYKVLASKAKIQASASGALAQGAGARVWGKNVARGAWRELERSGLIMAEGGGAGGKCRVDVGLEEIGASGVELGAWGRWCKEI